MYKHIAKMSRIEQLSDDFEESLKLDEATKLEAEDVAIFEEMYSNRLAKKGAEKPETDPRSFEEVMLELSKTPLFMNNLNDAADAGMQTVSDYQAISQMLRSICRWRESRTRCYSSIAI